MGQVYRARHLQLGKAYALKIIAPTFASDQVARQRFNQEAKLASEISHPNIVSVVDFGEDEQFGAFMVMELVEGNSLLNDGPLPMAPKRALDVLAQVADALDCIHKRGIIHGDVKADNIMLVSESETTAQAHRRRVVRLLDFGLARGDGHDEEEAGVSGSPHYLAPERCAGGPASVQTDIYALGVLGYLLLTGGLPYEGSVTEIMMAHIHDTPDSLAGRLEEPVDQALERLIARAMSKDPAGRYGSADAFRRELDAVMNMLDLGRRRARGSGLLAVENPREAVISEAFESSRLAQALVSIDGVLAVANTAFAKLIGHDSGKSIDGVPISDTALNTFVPGLMRALRACHTDGKPQERRAKVFRGADKPPLELVIWMTPLSVPGYELHLIVRVDELVESRR